MKLTTLKERLSLSLDDDVALIEVEDIVGPDEDDFESRYFRTIRFVSYNGREILEVFLSADTKQAVELRRVKQLQPVKKKKIRVKNWLTGKRETQEILDEGV